MENNIMNEGMDVMVEEIVADEVVVKAPDIVKNIGKGAGIVAGVAAVAWAVKKIYDGYQAKKELRQPDKEIVVEAEQVEEVAEPEV